MRKVFQTRTVYRSPRKAICFRLVLPLFKLSMQT
ncbi:unnamed protein product [Rhodiola kirilowii]